MICVQLECEKCTKLVAAFIIEDQPDDNDWYHATIDIANIKLECPHRFP